MRYLNTTRRSILSYGVYGFILGLVFPLLGILYEMLRSESGLSFLALQKIHQEQHLLLIIDLAPLVLAIFSALIGLQSARLHKSSEWIKKQVQAQASQAKKEQFFYEALIMNSPFAVVQLDLARRIISFNPAFEELFGFTGSEIIGRPLDEIIASDGLISEAEKLSKAVASGNIVKTVSHRKKKDGSLLDVEIVGIPVFVGGEQLGILSLYHDISRRKKSEQALRESEARFRSLFHDSPISLWEEDFSRVKETLDKIAKEQDLLERLRSDDELVKKCIRLVNILDVNQATLNLFNANTKRESLKNLSSILVEESLDEFRKELIALINGERSYECEIIQKKQDGEHIYGLLRLSLAPGYEDTWEKVFISILDISERKQAEEKLRYLSFHDALTGLYNRAYFEEEMNRLENSRQFPISIIVCDLDNLKQVNDTLGHDTGDQAIKAVAEILTATVFRAEDAVARIGGDEFAIILPNIDIRERPSIMSRLKQAINEFNAMEGSDGLYRPVSLSYGFATIPFGESLMDGFKHADEQMYINKLRNKSEMTKELKDSSRMQIKEAKDG